MIGAPGVGSTSCCPSRSVVRRMTAGFTGSIDQAGLGVGLAVFGFAPDSHDCNHATRIWIKQGRSFAVMIGDVDKPRSGVAKDCVRIPASRGLSEEPVVSEIEDPIVLSPPLLVNARFSSGTRAIP